MTEFWAMGMFEIRLLFTDEAQAAFFFIRPSSDHALKKFHLANKNQSVYGVSGTSRCYFSDKYKTHQCTVGRAYSS